MNIQIRLPEDTLRLEGLVVEKIDDTSYDDEVFIHASPTAVGVEPCPFCRPKPTTVHRHALEKGIFRDVTAWGKKVSIIVDRQRFLCKGCKKTWTGNIPSLHQRRMMTARLEKHIAIRCFTTTQINVAREYGIDEGTVRNIFREYMEEKERGTRFETPRVLGIDEIFLPDAKGVLTNVEKRSVFDILPSRNKDHLIPYFTDLPDKQNVEVVVADMWKPYHDIADRFFPGRLVVVDKFHVVRMAHNGLDLVRKSVGRARTPEDRIRLKHERKLLHKRKANLDERERDRVNAWLTRFPELRQAYEVKERFTDMFDAPNRREGTKEIEKCMRSIPIALDPAFSELTTAVANWKTRILNYFEDPVTNGYTEAVNGLIRLDDRVGRGYSFEVMRARILYDETARSKTTSTRYRRKAGMADDVIGYYNMLDDLELDDDTDDVEVVEYGPDIATVVAMLTREADERAEGEA